MINPSVLLCVSCVTLLSIGHFLVTKCHFFPFKWPPVAVVSVSRVALVGNNGTWQNTAVKSRWWTCWSSRNGFPLLGWSMSSHVAACFCMFLLACQRWIATKHGPFDPQFESHHIWSYTFSLNMVQWVPNGKWCHQKNMNGFLLQSLDHQEPLS